MPDSLEAALVFSILIVPGYLLLRGYYVGRAHVVPERDLYVLAQAVVASLIWLAATWIVVQDLLHWIADDALDDHEAEAYAIGALIVVVPYLVGRVLGLVVSLAGRLEADQRWPARAFRWVVFRLVAVIEHQTAWERAWGGRRKAYVIVSIEGGRTVWGEFAAHSKVDVAPLKPQIYLEETYEVLEDGTTIPRGAMHVDGSRIVSVEFL